MKQLSGRLRKAVKYINQVQAGVAIKQSKDRIIEQIESNTDDVSSITDGFVVVMGRRFKDIYNSKELVLILKAM